MYPPTAYLRTIAAMLLLFLLASFGSVLGQSLSSNDRAVGHIMLKNVKDAIKKNYYDPNFHGVNLEDTFKDADEKINQATSNGQVCGIISKAVMSLNTRTRSFPPDRPCA